MNSTTTNVAANPTLFNVDAPSDYSLPNEPYPTITEQVPVDNQFEDSSRFEQPVMPSKRTLNEPTISLDSIERMSGDRISRLKNLSVRPGSASIEELENQPAYMRRNVELNEAPTSDTSNVSRYSLTLDPETNQVEIRPNNSFLHDKPD
jgi:cell division protein FtsZ